MRFILLSTWWHYIILPPKYNSFNSSFGDLNSPLLNQPFPYLYSSTQIGCLYAIGGLDGNTRLNTVERFDPKTGVWQRVASMNYRRSALGAAVLNGRIYVCGGYDGVSSLRTCEVYNPEQNQ